MARIHHDSSVSEIIGSLNTKNGITIRKKIFRDFDGMVTKEGRLEAYKPNPRNFRANPATPRERANQKAFGKASSLAKELIDAAKFNTPLSPEKQTLLENYKMRFRKQLKGRPDPVAAKDRDGNFTTYARLDNFIRAILRKENPLPE